MVLPALHLRPFHASPDVPRQLPLVHPLLTAEARQMISYVLYNICKHPEYLEPLREEAKKMDLDAVCTSKNEDAPLLDSFLKEVSRLYPIVTSKFSSTSLQDSSS